MKKIQMQLQEVSKPVVLTRSQLKTVLGGDNSDGSGSGLPNCADAGQACFGMINCCSGLSCQQDPNETSFPLFRCYS